MATPHKVRYGGAVYALASPEDVADLLVTAAPPKSPEEWKAYATDLFQFYATQLEQLDQVDETAAALQQVQQTITAVEQQYAAAKQSMDIRVLRDAMSYAHVTKQQTLKSALPRLKQQLKKLKVFQKARKGHEKLKKQIDKMTQRGLKKWL